MVAACVGNYGRVRKARELSLATVYLITDRRIIYAAEWPSGAEFRWVWLGELPAHRVRLGEQGVGTISFSGGVRGGGAWHVPPLRAVPDVARVADLIIGVRGPRRGSEVASGES